MSGSPTFVTQKKEKAERGEFITPPRPTGRRSNSTQNAESAILTLSQELYYSPFRGYNHKCDLAFNPGFALINYRSPHRNLELANLKETLFRFF